MIADDEVNNPKCKRYYHPNPDCAESFYIIHNNGEHIATHCYYCGEPVIEITKEPIEGSK